MRILTTTLFIMAGWCMLPAQPETPPIPEADSRYVLDLDTLRVKTSSYPESEFQYLNCSYKDYYIMGNDKLTFLS